MRDESRDRSRIFVSRVTSWCESLSGVREFATPDDYENVDSEIRHYFQPLITGVATPSTLPPPPPPPPLDPHLKRRGYTKALGASCATGEGQASKDSMVVALCTNEHKED